MDDQEFVHRIQQKIERLTNRSIELRIDRVEDSQLRVELDREIPLVVLGSNIFRYSGFARMGVEYAVASIQRQKEIDALEFHLLLARN
jgi:hypothetical protein